MRTMCAVTIEFAPQDELELRVFNHFQALMKQAGGHYEQSVAQNGLPAHVWSMPSTYGDVIVALTMRGPTATVLLMGDVGACSYVSQVVGEWVGRDASLGGVVTNVEDVGAAMRRYLSFVPFAAVGGIALSLAILWLILRR